MNKKHNVLIILFIFAVAVLSFTNAYTDNCHEHCIHCSASDGNTCKKCRHNLYLYNGTCVEACPNEHKETVQHVIGDQGYWGRESGLECQNKLTTTGNVLVAVGQDKMGGVPPYPVINVIQVAIATHCVASLSSDGTVKAWGNYYLYGGSHCGGVAPPNLKDVKQLYASGFGMCALHYNNTVTCWGSEGGNTNPPLHTESSVGKLDKNLTNIKRLFSTQRCFIAVDRDDKIAHCWGGNDGASGREWHCCSHFDSTKAINVDTVFTNSGDFVVLRKDKTIYSFGYSFRNDASGSATNYRGLTNVKTVISAAKNGFIAILENGEIDTWGQQNHQVLNQLREPSPTTNGNLLVNIKHVYVNFGAFVALKNEGTIAHAWGSKNHGGCGDTNECSSSYTAPPNDLGGKKIVNIVSTSSAFILMLEDTTVAGFGRLGYGGDPPANTTCISVVGSDSAAACIQPDGILTAWPLKDPNENNAQNYGGDVTHYSPAKNVTSIKSPGSLAYPDSQHFIARTSDGKAIAWGQDPSSTIPQAFTDSGQNIIEIFALFKAYIAIKNCFGEYYADSANMCQHCPDGYSGNNSKSNVGLAACKACISGSYRAGTTVNCQDCPSSRYSLNFASKECNQNTPGFYLSNCTDSTNFIGCGAINECEKGSMCNGTGAIAQCPLGKYQATKANQKCDDCPRGRYSDIIGALDCKMCEAGKMSSTTGASACSFCPDGEVPDDETRSICIKCLAGEYMNATTRSCEICPSGHSCQRGTSIPSTCSKGEYAPAGSADCQRCDLGKFNPIEKQRECLDCLPGKYQDDKGKDSCKDCRVDTFSNKKGNVAPEKCEKCTSFRPDTNTGGKTGALNEDACGCAMGKYFNLFASTKNEICQVCLEGSICNKFNNSIATMETDIGYWRSSSTSLEFHKCEDIAGVDHCVGGSAINSSQCRNGHEGTLCTKCIDGYIIKSEGVCEECENNNSGRTYGSGIPTAIVLFLLIFVAFTCYQYYHAVKLEMDSFGRLSKNERNAVETVSVFTLLAAAKFKKSIGKMSVLPKGIDDDDDTTITSLAKDEVQGTVDGEVENAVNDGQEIEEVGEDQTEITEEGSKAVKQSLQAADSELFMEKLPGLMKIFISFIQIFTHLSITFTIPWPSGFLNFINFPLFKLLNIDFAAVLGTFDPCSLYTPFLQRFVYHVCLMPIIICILLFVSFIYGKTIVFFKKKEGKKSKDGKQEDMQKMAIQQRTIKLINFIVFLMYPGLSVKIFSVFKCVEVDQGRWYLANDMGIECFQPYWNNYYWWECLEMLKKMMLTGGLILLGPGSSAQILLAILIMEFYFFLLLKYNPYQEDDDDFLQLIATIVILLTLIGGMALRADDATSSGFYEAGMMSALFILINISIFIALIYTIFKETAGMRAAIAHYYHCVARLCHHEKGTSAGRNYHE
eukprot:g12163.t1